MEPGWTKNIPNSTICNFFYVFYVVYAILFVISLLFTIGLFTYSKKTGIAVGLSALFTTAIVGVMTMCLYLICDRALIEKFLDEGFSSWPPTTLGNFAKAAAGVGSVNPTADATSAGALAGKDVCGGISATSTDIGYINSCATALSVTMCPTTNCTGGLASTTGIDSALCNNAVNTCLSSNKTVPASITFNKKQLPATSTLRTALTTYLAALRSNTLFIKNKYQLFLDPAGKKRNT